MQAPTLTMRSLLVSGLLWPGLLVPGLARAADLPCPPAEAGTITLDGMIDDWRDVAALTAGDGGAGLSVRCNTEGKTLYLSFEASDDRVIRTPQARPGEDHITFRLGEQRYTVFPTAGANKARLSPGGAKIASTTSDKGFVIELAFPFGKIPGLGRGLERLPLFARFDDCDTAASLKTERSVTIEGELAFTAGPSTLDGFLQERGLARSLVRWQKPVRAGKGAVQLVLVGKLVAAIGEGYSYVELPVADGTDVRGPQLVDLAGDGRQAVLLQYVERGEGGERTVLAAFRPVGAEVKRVFAVEIGKRSAGGRLSSKVQLKKRGKATDILLVAEPAQGFTAESYQEAPASDIVPILLPWTAEKKASFSFSGDSYQRR